jgi:glutamine amidotransferase
MTDVAVIDYGMGNLHSIGKALQHACPDVQVNITRDVHTILTADRVVFPGVGAIRDCMLALNETSLAEVIVEAAKTRPFLGICLGMQALLTHSEENGSSRCLNIIPGQVKRFAQDLHDDSGSLLKIPHMGWNQVHYSAHPLWHKIPQDSRFYFVHSYYAVPNLDAVVSATTDYPEAFACALASGNIFAVQFHPEKSQTAGLQLLKNFLQWDGKV